MNKRQRKPNKKRSGTAHRYANGKLRRGVEQEILKLVVSLLEQMTPRDKILSDVKEQYNLEKPEEWVARGEAQFLQLSGFSKAQYRFAITQAAIEALTSPTSSYADKHRAGQTLAKICDLEADSDTEDKSRQVTLWKQLFDHCDIEQLDFYRDQMRTGVFDIDAISEEDVESMVSASKKRKSG